MKAKLAKRKTGFCMRMKESWKEMKLWDAEELNKLDWVISALILIFLFFYLCLWRSDADGKQVIFDV